jgi:hypothetical protein
LEVFMRKNVRNLFSTSCLLVASLTLALFSGCATEEEAREVTAAEPSQLVTVPEGWGIDPRPVSTIDDGKVVPGQDVVIQAGCSVVEYCNAPGSDGSRCRQQGCTLANAIAECESETRQFCGTPQCPWIFVATGGTRYTRTPCP